MFEYVKAIITNRKDRKNHRLRIETLEKAIEGHLIDHDDLNFKALELLQRVEMKIQGKMGGRPKKEPEEQEQIRLPGIIKGGE